MEARAAPPVVDTSRNWNINSSNCSTPYISAPSSPQRTINFFYYSAPTSPRSSSSAFFADRLSLLSDEGPPSPSAVVPFDWEFAPGVPKSSSTTDGGTQNNDDDDNDFEFDFSGQLVRPSLSSADELFDGGKIRPLKPPPPVKISGDSPRSPMARCRAALSPKQRKKNLEEEDPFEAALQSTRKSEILLSPEPKFNGQTRGRSLIPTNQRANSRKGISRSLSPLRVSEFALLHHQDPSSQMSPQNQGMFNGSSSKSGKKWRLKDFLLFRSASDGRAAITGSGKDPLKKYFSMGATKKGDEGSFRSTASSTAEGSVSRRRGRLSAHELHYTANRAVSEEMKKKTSLPYKHGGILSCLGFNPALQKAFGSFAAPS